MTPCPQILQQTSNTFLQSRAMRLTGITEKATKRVRFSQAYELPEPNPLTQDDIRPLWYSQDQLNAFREEVKAIAKSYEGQELPRGMELCSDERLRHRYMSVQCVKSAVRRGVCPQTLATISQKCAAWNTEVAFVQACHDYAHAYDQSLLSVLPKLSAISYTFPFSVKKRSSDEIDESACRTVRRRMTWRRRW